VHKPVFHDLLCEQLEAICNILSLNIEYSSFLFGSVFGKNFHVVQSVCADKSFRLYRDQSWDNRIQTTVPCVHCFPGVPC